MEAPFHCIHSEFPIHLPLDQIKISKKPVKKYQAITIKKEDDLSRPLLINSREWFI